MLELMGLTVIVSDEDQLTMMFVPEQIEHEHQTRQRVAKEKTIEDLENESGCI